PVHLEQRGPADRPGRRRLHAAQKQAPQSGPGADGHQVSGLALLTADRGSSGGVAMTDFDHGAGEWARPGAVRSARPLRPGRLLLAAVLASPRQGFTQATQTSEP